MSETTRLYIVDSVTLTKRGIRAVKWSFIALMLTALLQVIVVILSGSVALLADTIHNFEDALTAIPLWIAFKLSQKRPSKRFTYGYGRAEDLAGLFIVMLILASAGFVAYESINRFFNPHDVKYVGILAIAGLIGFIGNEAVAVFRIKIGREIKSESLVADGYHARIDGLTSLGVVAGAIGIWLGFPLADPIVGIGITFIILKIGFEVAKSIFIRLLDGVDPEIIKKIKDLSKDEKDVKEVTDIRARWSGHKLYAEVNITVDSQLPVDNGHKIAEKVRHNLLHHLNYLSDVIVHVDPSGIKKNHHQIKHKHGSLRRHSH